MASCRGSFVFVVDHAVSSTRRRSMATAVNPATGSAISTAERRTVSSNPPWLHVVGRPLRPVQDARLADAVRFDKDRQTGRCAGFGEAWESVIRWAGNGDPAAPTPKPVGCPACGARRKAKRRPTSPRDRWGTRWRRATPRPAAGGRRHPSEQRPRPAFRRRSTRARRSGRSAAGSRAQSWPRWNNVATIFQPPHAVIARKRRSSSCVWNLGFVDDERTEISLGGSSVLTQFQARRRGMRVRA